QRDAACPSRRAAAADRTFSGLPRACDRPAGGRLGEGDSSVSTTQGKVLKFVQDLLTDEDETGPISAALINEKIDQVLRMKPRWGEELDRDRVTDELIRRFSL